MLILYYPKQIPSIWPFLKEGLEAGLPPFTLAEDDTIANVLEAILAERMQVWLICPSAQEQNTLLGFVVTTVVQDAASRSRNLLIYCLYTARPADQKLWLDGFNAIQAFARSEECGAIIAYTQVPAIVNRAESFGADTSQTFIRFNLD